VIEGRIFIARLSGNAACGAWSVQARADRRGHCTDRAIDSSAPSEQGETQVSGRKILIIDDDPHLLLGLTPRLAASNYSVVTATDAISAVSVARKEVPDLIILDLGLPGGDGFLVLERIRNLAGLAATPFIV
jgi:PleD family two-component response regulator